MYGRLQSLAARSGRVEASFGRLGSRIGKRAVLTTARFPLSGEDVHGPQKDSSRGRDRSRGTSSRSSISHLHTTPQSLSSAMMQMHESADEYDDKDLDADVALFTSTIFGLEDLAREREDAARTLEAVEESNRSLNLELGIDPAWEQQEDEDFEAEADASTGPPSDAHVQQQQPLQRKRHGREILRNFDPQNPPDSDNPEELQLWLECAAQQEAVMRYQSLIEKARDRKAYDSMSIMQRQVVQWHEALRDGIETSQKEYLANKESRRAQKRYGPFLCSLHPEKMAVILAHEAITHLLLTGGSNGKEGVPLVRIARSLGLAMETEVISQRRLKERFRGADSLVSKENSDSSDEPAAEKSPRDTILERWKFSASHLKTFMDEMQRADPKMGKNKRSIEYAMRRARQSINSADGWANDDLVHLGAALLMILVENATIVYKGKHEPAFHVEKRWANNEKSTSFIVMNPNLHRLFAEDEFVSWAASTTRHTPMIVPPTDWTGPTEGGYRWLQVELMRTHGSSVQKEALQHGDLTQVCEGLNILGKTAWKINKTILEVGQACWDKNIPIGDIPSRTDFDVPDEPARPARIDPEVYSNPEHPDTIAALQANKSYREAMYKRRRFQQKNMDLRSLRCSATLKLNQAEKFKDFERIYFPYNLDFRGRAYPVPPHLSNVGSDLCRGMLKFADAKPLGKRGLYWLKVHLANFAGKDKVSFDDRAKYIEENMDKVRQAVENPFSDDPWWMTLDDPFQGLATCHEIINAVDSGDPENYMCDLPVHMDGSCNGLQHYAALGRDVVGGKAVNLMEGDGPQDVYIGVMHEVIRRVAEEAERVVTFDTSNPDSLTRHQKKELKNNQAAKLVNGLIDRGVVKRTVMTSVYGVTYVGARQQIQEKIEEKLEEKGLDIDEIDREVFAAAGYLATVTMEVMGDLFQGARNTKSWLAECARLISQQGHPVAWISPVGVPAVQPYRQPRPRTIVTVMQSVTVADESDDLPVHKSRQCTAFPPNYVHSLDSSHMLLTAMEMDRRGLAFSAVHDSFWTHACDIDEMNGALRDCFVDLYSRPLLANLKESWELRYPQVQFPDLPELGELDLEGVKSATYFFQ